jgi:hypothetical protein
MATCRRPEQGALVAAQRVTGQPVPVRMSLDPLARPMGLDPAAAHLDLAGARWLARRP